MDIPKLMALGLEPRVGDHGPAFELPLSTALLNPITGAPILRVGFELSGDRLLPTTPSEAVGLPPLSLSTLTSRAELEDQLVQSFEEAVRQLQRRSEELQALGLAAHIHPQHLSLTADVPAGDYLFTLSADKRGTLGLIRTLRAGLPLSVDGMPTFELSEFREQVALVGYLLALVEEPDTREGLAPPRPLAVAYEEVVERFGAGLLLPPRSALELLVALRVRGEQYRFAAARVSGRTFRGLLAGPRGKVWAERFELEDFPGVRDLVAASLQVPVESVEVLGADEE